MHGIISSSKSLTCLSCLLVLLVSGCGGNPSSSSSSNSQPVGDPSAPTVASGLYVGTYLSKEWLTVLTPDQTGIANFYALYFSGDDPDLYSGRLIGMGTSNLSGASLAYFQNLSSQIRIGSGSITSPTAGQINETLGFPSVGVEPAKSVNVALTKPVSTSYFFETNATLNSLNSNWTGRLSYGLGSVNGYSLTFDGNGTITSFPTFMQDCKLLNGYGRPYGANINLYSIQISFDNTTQCLFRNKILTGVALIINNPIAGKTQRLQLLAVTSSGEGLSFRADK